MRRAVKPSREPASPRARVAAVVLAAGSSSRMGRPKPLVSVLERPLLDRVLETIRSSHAAETVVVLGADAKRIRREVDLRGATVVVNPEPSEGMGSSLRWGAQAIASTSVGFFVVLGDQPFIKPATLDALIDRFASGTDKILVPTYEGVRGNPVLLDRALIPELGRLRGDVGCRAIFPGHLDEIREVPVRDPGILIDVDTPAELQRVERVLGGTASPSAGALKSLVADRIAFHREGPVRPLPKLRGSSDAAALAELLVIGEAPVAKAVAALGGFLGFRVIVAAPGARASDFPDGIRWEPDLDRLPELVTPETFVVVASTGLYDEIALQAILPKPSRYVGLVASHRRGEAVLGALRSHGLSTAQLDRVRHPAGLPIAAQDSEEIALSILSEITRVRRTEPSEAPAFVPAPPSRGVTPSHDPV